MNKEFIPYTQALDLKKLGFDEPCFGLYHNDKTFYPTQCKSHEQFHGQVCSAPLYQQAFRWFREKYGLDSWVYKPNEKLNIWGYNTTLHINVSPFKSYEEAELACLDKLIEITKTKTNE